MGPVIVLGANQLQLSRVDAALLLAAAVLMLLVITCCSP
jgi:hypothetical protein